MSEKGVHYGEQHNTGQTYQAVHDQTVAQGEADSGNISPSVMRADDGRHPCGEAQFGHYQQIEDIVDK